MGLRFDERAILAAAKYVQEMGCEYYLDLHTDPRGQGRNVSIDIFRDDSLTASLSVNSGEFRVLYDLSGRLYEYIHEEMKRIW